MLGFSHALDSSGSSSSCSSLSDKYESSCSEEDEEKDEELNSQTRPRARSAVSRSSLKSRTDSDTDVFVKHLRKAFITLDENCYCEHGILPDLKIFNSRTTRAFKSCRRHHHKKKEQESENEEEARDQMHRSILARRIELDSYEYVKIYSKTEMIIY